MNRDKQEIQERLWRAVEAGDYRAIRTTIMNGADIDARDEQGRTAFQIATQRGDSEAAWILLAARELKFNMQLGMKPEEIFPPAAEEKAPQRRPITDARKGKGLLGKGKLRLGKKSA